MLSFTYRIAIATYLTEFFGTVIDNYNDQTVIESVYLCLNRVSGQ